MLLIAHGVVHNFLGVAHGILIRAVLKHFKVRSNIIVEMFDISVTTSEIVHRVKSEIVALMRKGQILKSFM